MLARQSGLSLGPLGGVVCDAGLRTSAPDVFAAGDMAEWDSALHGRPARVEHFEVAAAHGRTVARNMLGDDVAHEEMPYFWSDLSDWATSEYVGIAAPGEWDAEVMRGAPDEASFSVWLLRDGRVVGVMAVDRGDDLDAGRALIASRTQVSPERIADASTDLAALAGRGGTGGAARPRGRPRAARGACLVPPPAGLAMPGPARPHPGGTLCGRAQPRYLRR